MIATVLWVGGGLGKADYIYKLSARLDFAHRGCCMELPRNCMAAFDRAASQNMAIETDVRMTKDGRLVLFHDDTTSIKLDLPGSISLYTYSELEKTSFIQYGKTTPHRIVALDSLVQKHPNTPIYLDIKTPSMKLADTLVRTLDKLQNSNYLIADANILFLAYLKWKNPGIVTVWEGFDAGKEWTYSVIPKKFKPNYLASFTQNVTENHLRWLKENKLLQAKIVYGDTREGLEVIPYHIVECK